MTDTRRRTDGDGNTMGYDAEKSAGDLESSRRLGRASTTAGADLGGAAARARGARPPAEETDESKMSPLARMAYQAKKRRKATTDDAANALANR
jgi:hypothetical protein